MPSFDDLYDFLGLLDHQGFRYIVLTIGKGPKGEDGDSLNLDHFVNLKNKTEKQVMVMFMRELASAIEKEIEPKKKKKNPRKPRL